MPIFHPIQTFGCWNPHVILKDQKFWCVIVDNILKNILLLVMCVQDAKVTTLGTVPSLVRTWKASGCMADLDWSSIRFGSVHYLPVLQLTNNEKRKAGCVEWSFDVDLCASLRYSEPLLGGSILFIIIVVIFLPTRCLFCRNKAMIRENQQLATNEPVEFEK